MATPNPYVIIGGVPLPSFPAPDTNDTYAWTDVQKARKGALITKLPLNQNLDGISTDILANDSDEPARVSSIWLTRSTKWFTLTEASVSQDGKIYYKVAASQTAKTQAEPIDPPPLPSSFIPFRRDADFVEHGNILEQLDEKAAAPGSWAALVGLGGVGKSQLAIEQGYRTRVRSPETWVFWVHAGSAARFEQSYRDIADQVKIRGRQDPQANLVKLVREWLRDPRHGPWLLILDNLDDAQIWSEAEAFHTVETKSGGSINRYDQQPQPLASYLPCCEHGRVLLTTRSRGIALMSVEEKEIITVEPMSPSDAVALLKKKLGSVKRGEDTEALVTTLEWMPLAIVQAGAYIAQRAPRYSVRQYLEEFRQSDRKKMNLLDYEGGRLRRDQEARNSIIITWQISFNHIQRTRPSAAELLSLISFFDRQGIPEALVRKRASDGVEHRGQEEPAAEREDNGEASECREDDDFEDDVLMLRNYSFLSVEINQTFTMHALVQLATRRWLTADGQLERWKQLYIKTLSTEFLNGEYKN